MRVLLLVMAAALTGCAHVQTAAAPVAARLLGTVDAAAIIGPPPEAGSPRALAELTPPTQPWPADRVAQAQRDNAIDPFLAFSAVMGPGFTADAKPATQKLFRMVTMNVGPPIGVAKDRWKRDRPFVAVPTWPTCINPDDRLRASGSYPSGHSALGWSWALALAQAAPAKADAILTRGREYGDSRVVCGVHFPSDVEAGRTLAAAEIARLNSDADFQAAVKAAAAELGR